MNEGVKSWAFHERAILEELCRSDKIMDNGYCKLKEIVISWRQDLVTYPSANTLAGTIFVDTVNNIQLCKLNMIGFSKLADKHCLHPFKHEALPYEYVPECFDILRLICSFMSSIHALCTMGRLCKSMYFVVGEMYIPVRHFVHNIFQDALFHRCEECLTSVSNYHHYSSANSCWGSSFRATLKGLRDLGLKGNYGKHLNFILREIKKSDSVTKIVVKLLIEQCAMPFMIFMASSKEIISYCCKHKIVFNFDTVFANCKKPIDDDVLFEFAVEQCIRHYNYFTIDISEYGHLGPIMDKYRDSGIMMHPELYDLFV